MGDDTMTDDDRNLLERAARAAGLYEDWPAPDYEVQWNGDGMWCCGMGRGYLWNPLTDDGDALRLAVKLRIGVLCYGETVVTLFEKPGDIGPVPQRRTAVVEGDESAAVRRAITRAAAEMAQ